jgi:membrane-bound lytic murein transglycosylase A
LKAKGSSKAGGACRPPRPPSFIRSILAAALLAGCVAKPASPPPPSPELAQASYSDLPGWTDDKLTELLPALRLQCRKLAMLPPDTALGGTGLAATYGGLAGQWTDPCRAALDLDPNDDPHEFFQRWFTPYRVTTAALVTGYFEPVLHGDLHQGGAYQVPVLARPADLVAGTEKDAEGRPLMGRLVAGALKPYFSRTEIEAGSLGDAAHPLAWLTSPLDLFFAQIQGSALIELPDGTTRRLAFDGRNGRPYTPIGRILIEQHAIATADVSMQSIRAWLEAHPDQAKAVMDRNESYVFFRLAPDANAGLGPPGALGVALTAGRSAAVDRSFVPLAAPLFVDSTIPDGRAWRHLVLAQDLGSAIAGPARVDVFLGSGAQAADWAGRMRQSGRIWLLLPRSVSVSAR